MAAVTISILERNTSQITLAWDPQDQSTIVSFKLYVSLTDVTANYQVAQINIPNVPAAYGFGHNLVTTVLTLAQVQALSGMSAAVFGITPLYFRATTVDTSVAESAIASSPSRPYDFDRTGPSGRIGTLYGAQLVSANPLYDDNYTVSRTMVGTTGAFYVTQETIYITGSPTGSRAKQINYTGPWSVDGKATKVEAIDILKP